MNTDQKASIVDVSMSVLKVMLINRTIVFLCQVRNLVVLTFRTISLYKSPLHPTKW